VHNYGSLAARLLLAPLEESARLIFSKAGVSGGVESQRRRQQLLTAQLKLAVFLGLTFASFGPNYTRLFLQLLLLKSPQSSWNKSEVANALSWYCLYLLVMAINGVLEAFAFAVANHRQVSQISFNLVVSFSVFCASAAPLMREHGTSGLVMANTLSMACRIAPTFIFVATTIYPPDFAGNLKTWVGRCWRLVTEGFPHPLILVVFALSFWTTSSSDKWASSTSPEPENPLHRCQLLHVAAGCCCLFLVTLTTLVLERRIFKFSSLRQGSTTDIKIKSS